MSIPTPTMEIFPPSLSSLTINCVGVGSTENNILYSQTIPNIYYYTVQEVSGSACKRIYI